MAFRGKEASTTISHQDLFIVYPSIGVRRRAACVFFSLSIADDVQCIELGSDRADRQRPGRWSFAPRTILPGATTLLVKLSAWGHPDFEWNVRICVGHRRMSDPTSATAAAVWREGGLLDNTGNSEELTVRFALTSLPCAADRDLLRLLEAPLGKRDDCHAISP